jgi:hypothetical protein
MTLLAEYHAPPPVDEITFGDSLALRARLPRARRGPVPKSKPFDAGEVYHTDSQLPDITEWRITALIEATKRILTWEDLGESSDRESRLERVRIELERRGLDFEELIRCGLFRRIAISLDAVAVTSRLIPGFESRSSRMAELVKAWMPALGLEHLEPVALDDLPQAVMDSYSGQRLRRIIRWTKIAPIADIINLTPPVDLTTYHDVHNEACDRKYGWLVDRFTSTYLWQWDIASLKQEWSYQHGLLNPPCRTSDMATIRIAENDLAKQIVVDSVESDDEERSPSFAASDYVPVALGLIESGRRKEAAAIFEATTMLSPRDPFALNNWAFCLMPDSPEKALELLDRAAQDGLRDNLMIIGNRLWCLSRLSRNSTALSVADTVIGSLADRPLQSAHMWSPLNDSVERVMDLRIYVLDLIANVVNNSADQAMSERWRPLLNDARVAISNS